VRLDEAPFLGAQENCQAAIAEDMALAGETGDVTYLAILPPVKMDGSTQGEFVQNTLFML